MQFKCSSREDITRYFRGTYVRFKEYGEQWFFIENINNDRVTGKHESGENFVIYLDDDTPYEVDYLLPHKTFFQYDKNAVLLERVPAKQYYRGLCPQNVHLSYHDGVKAVRVFDLGFTILQKYTSKQKWFSLTEAINCESAITCAMSSRMMYHRIKKEIWIDFCPVARVDIKKNLIIVHNTIFFNEVQELINSHNEEDKYVVHFPLPKPVKEPVPVKPVKHIEKFGTVVKPLY